MVISNKVQIDALLTSLAKEIPWFEQSLSNLTHGASVASLANNSKKYLYAEEKD